MDFISFYKAIPDKMEKRQIRWQILTACQIEPPTFYAWLIRGKIPFLAQKEIAIIMQTPQSELFPIKATELKHVNKKAPLELETKGAIN